MISDEKIAALLNRFAYLEAKMNDGASGEEMVRAAREYAELRPVAEQAQAYQDMQIALSEARELLGDPDMAELAKDEITDLEAQLYAQTAELQIALLPKDAADTRPAIMEIRAGTGGDEAALFAADLMRMYQRYVEGRGWKFEIIEESLTELGGIRDLVVSIQGDGVFARLKFESGVHRVQRVPSTESGGRIHTSAATVAVLPEAEDVDVEIRTEDIRIDTMRASGAGGQHVNTTDSAVRITHLPTGIVVTSSEKSQHTNRAKAMQVLRTRLFDLQRAEADAERAAERKGQVGSGDRSERIRTYNFPQGRMTDHRVNLTLYKLDQVIAGDLDEIIDALLTADQAERLAAMEGQA